MEQYLRELLIVPEAKVTELTSLATALTTLTQKGQGNGQGVRVDHLAKQLCTSERNLRRKCAKMFGLSPSELLMKVRIEQAKHLLNKGHSIGDVAYHVGFTTHSHFSNVFKRYVGKAPSAFRNNKAQR
ncbi:AraC family transcriptional regulator [Bowmanella sp. JS7-9]|uniref:Helix-turn-helix domain-containing protein n=1 Tax=Pseudobowmanella zhangzhouensis TaxID=1537679 RepID=A0ABW1XPM0_9ALTE|nr:helix-turn-helix transcriptional regulator [Bowmanella sp. JS7-9]TBX21860.1 hypothetical protein TK45_10175 [Bowmanella sp. JS7-9]